MHFTIDKDKETDEKIRSDLATIKEQLLAHFDGIVTLVLVGGFGRGEGAIIIKNGEITPVNDYDIEMIVKRPVDRKRVNMFSRSLAKQVGVRWIDIHISSRFCLRWLPFTMYNYDLKYGGYVFYGDRRALSMIPEMDAERMPLVEGENLLFTRLWCFLGPFSTEFLHRELTQEERFFLSKQLSKALLACSDTLLLLEGDYDVSYVKRLQRFQQPYPDAGRMNSLVEWATTFKLKPTLESDDLDLVPLYFEVKDLFLDTLNRFASTFYQREFEDWPAFSRAYMTKPMTLLKRLVVWMGNTLLRKGWQYENRERVKLAQLYLIAAYSKRGRGVDKHLLNMAHKMVQKAGGVDCIGCDWEETRKIVVDLQEKLKI